MTQMTRKVLLSSTAILFFAQLPSAWAQDATEETSDARQEIVVVTATRRAESIQDVPISATAYSAETIDRLRLQSTSDIGDQAPNINLVQGNFGFGAPIISVRGVTNGDFSATSNTPVTVYSDDIPLTQIVSQGFGLYDLERIELLRGPQGTLFGRNATSGALQFISAGPTSDFEAGVSATAARHNALSLDGYISGPLIKDKVEGRLAFNAAKRDGVVPNLALNQDESELEYWAGRALLDFHLAENHTIRAKAAHSESHGTGVLFHNSLGDNEYLTNSLFGGPVEVGGDTAKFKAITLDLPERPEDVVFDEFMVKSELGLNNNWTLTSILGYTDLDFEEFNDDDASLARGTHEYANRQVEQLSAEFRLSGELGPVDLVSGLFFMKEDTKSVGAFEFTDDPLVGTLAQIGLETGFGLTPQLAATDRLVTTTELEQELNAFALFAHGTFDISERVSGRFGLRYSKDKKDITVFDGNVSSFSSADPFFFGQSVQNNPAFANFIDIGGIFQAAGSVSDKIESDAITGEAAIEFKPVDDIMLYASYQRGFKGSSFAPTQTIAASNLIPSVSEESVDAFEIGAKTSWANGRLIANAAAFHYNYSDFQAFEFLSVGGFLQSFLFSIPEVQIKGIEADIQSNPFGNLHLNAGIGFLDSEITNANVVLPPSVTLTITEGNQIRNAPETNFNMAAWYDFVSKSGNYYITPQIEYVYVGEYFSDFVNTPPGATYPNLVDGSVFTADKGSLAGDYDQFNVQIRFAPTDDRYALTIFGQNITAETQITGRFPGNLPQSGTDFATVRDGSATVWGVRLDASF